MGDNILTHFLSSFIAVSINPVRPFQHWLFLRNLNRLLWTTVGGLRNIPVSAYGCDQDETHELKGGVHSEWKPFYSSFISHEYI